MASVSTMAGLNSVNSGKGVFTLYPRTQPENGRELRPPRKGALSWSAETGLRKAGTGSGQHMRSNRQPDMRRNHGAFCLEKKKDIALILTERLKIPLPLGKDQVSLDETLSELLTALVKQRPWGIRSVSYDLDDFMETNS